MRDKRNAESTTFQEVCVNDIENIETAEETFAMNNISFDVDGCFVGELVRRSLEKHPLGQRYYATTVIFTT